MPYIVCVVNQYFGDSQLPSPRRWHHRRCPAFHPVARAGYFTYVIKYTIWLTVLLIP